MELVGIWSGDDSLFEALTARLGHKYSFLSGRHGAHFAGQELSLLIISPTAVGLAGIGILDPRLALIPGENVALARRVRALSAVSYGLGPQNTLTFSSLEPSAVSLALQREIHTLSGTLVERQEWVLPYDGLQRPDAFLCQMGALLLLGQEPETA